MKGKEQDTNEKLNTVLEVLKEFIAEEKERLLEGQAISDENLERLFECRKLLQETAQSSVNPEHDVYLADR